MGNRFSAKSIRIFSKRSVVLFVWIGLLASCSNNQPAASAESWDTEFHRADIQKVAELTCGARFSEVQALLQESLRGIKDFNSYDFDLSQLQFRTVERRGDTALVEVKGEEKVFHDGNMSPTEIKKDWKFVRESGVWKWCGEEPYKEYPTSLSLVSIGIIVLGGLFVVIVFLSLMFGNKPRGYSEFYAQSTDGSAPRIEEYQTGWVKSFSKMKGSGFIDDDRGKSYFIDYASFVNQRYHDLTNGERVLFQAEETRRGTRARNVIRVEGPTNSSNPHSRKLIILADRVKKLRQDFRFYKVTYLNKELNTCKAFFELLDLDVKRYHIKLMDYEVVLLYEVERDLHDLSDEIQSLAYDSRWWVRILHLILQTLNVVADIIQIASPRTAELLRSLGRGAGRLLTTKQPPLLGPGNK